jgi:N-hydroxyarylamine O-acetyltransferase
MNLDRYFARIGFAGKARADEATLRALHGLHVQAIPFENLDVLLGRRIDIAGSAVAKKLIDDRRGGYCFEHNTLFQTVLAAIGFHVEPFLARVRFNVPREVRTGLTHMILRVTIGGRPWLADVGFGGVGGSAPLLLDTEEEQATPHEPRRLLRRGSLHVHQALLGGEWKDAYEFVLEAPAPVDFELGNWYSCTHPQAHFINNLVVAKLDGPERLIITNREFTVRQIDGSAERHEIASPEELLVLLTSRFGMTFPKGTVFSAPGLSWPQRPVE